MSGARLLCAACVAALLATPAWAQISGLAPMDPSPAAPPPAPGAPPAAAAAADSRLALPAGWKLFRGQGGIMVPQPPGWRMNERPDGGLMAFLPGPGGGAEALVLAQPLKIQGQGSSVLQYLGQVFPDLFPQAAVDDLRRLSAEPEVVSGRLSYTAGQASYRGQALCYREGERGVVYALAATPRSWPAQRPAMLLMLRGIFYAAGQAQGDFPAAGLPAMTSFQDPNERAFSLPVPAGWRVEGGLKRFHAVDARVEVVATSPQGDITIRVGDAEVPPMSMATPQMAAMGFPEGSAYSPGYGLQMLVMRYLPGIQFATQFYLPRRLGQVQDLKARDLPEMGRQIKALYARGGMQVLFDAGEATFAAQYQGAPHRGYVFCQTMGMVAPGGHGMGTWQMERLFAYLAQPAAEPRAQAILAAMAGGFQLDPGWLARQSQTAGRVSQIVTETNNHTNQIIKQTFENRQRSQDRSAERFGRYIRGQVLVEDQSTGERFEVPSGGNYYWRLGSDQEAVATTTSDRPPHPHLWLERLEVVD